MEVDAAMDGATVLNPAFTVAIQQTNDEPSSFTISGTSFSLGMAWSLRTLIREDLGFGTPYVP